MNIQVSLPSGQNNEYFTRRLFEIYDNISIKYSENEKHLQQKL